MKVLRYDDIDVEEVIKRSEQDVNDIIPIVDGIINTVREKNDDALRDYTKQFDGVKIDDLKVSESEIKEAYNNIESALIETL